MLAHWPYVDDTLSIVSGPDSSITDFTVALNGFDRNFESLEKKYGKILLSSIENFWSKENQEKLNLQQQIVNKHYSWDARSAEWKNFFDEARSSKI